MAGQVGVSVSPTSWRRSDPDDTGCIATRHNSEFSAVRHSQLQSYGGIGEPLSSRESQVTDGMSRRLHFPLHLG